MTTLIKQYGVLGDPTPDATPTNGELDRPCSSDGVFDGLAGKSYIPCVAAGGAVDAITATYAPAITLADLTMCAFVAAGANITTTPTFAPNGLTAHTIVKQGGAALVAGDIPDAGAVCILEYNLASTRWELLNPKATAYTHPNHSGVVTSTGDGATAIADGALALSKLATQAAQTVNANATDSAAAPTAVAISASQIVARLAAGNLKGCSVAEILTLLNVAAGATAVTVEDTATDGHTTQAASSNVAYDIKTTADAALPKAGGTMTGAIVMGANGIDLTQALSSDHTWSGPILSGQTEGEALAFGNLVHQKITDGEWYKTDKDAEADVVGSLGIVVVRPDGDAGHLTVALPGAYIRDDTWAFDCLLFETQQYVGDSGALADQDAADAFTSGDQLRVVGNAYAFDTTKMVLHLNPESAWGEI